MFFVKPDFLKENPDATLLDCRFEMTEPEVGPAKYSESHIKGASYVDLDMEMVGEHSEHGGRHPLPNMEDFRAVMESKGVSDDKKVVIYDDGSLPMAARLWYMLRLIGKESYIVEGGFDAIKNAGFEATPDIPEVKKGTLTMNYREDLLVKIDEVLSAIEDDNTVIVDCRSNVRHLGIEEPYDKIAGRIPGTINVFWQNLLDGGSIRSKEEVDALFSELEKYDKVIFHCGSGITGAVSMFVYNEFGGKGALYAGSYSDYISYKGNKLIIKDNKSIFV